MKSTKRIMAVLLAVLTAVLLAVPAFAATKVYMMKAYYSIPQVGEKFPIGSVTSGAPEKYKASVYWYYFDPNTGSPETITKLDVVKSDVVYHCRTEFTANAGYELMGAFTGGAYYLNGKRATRFGGDRMTETQYRNGKYITGIDEDSSETVSRLAVTGVPSPHIGQTISAENVIVSEGFLIRNATVQSDESGKWAPADGVVRKDVNYRLSLTLDPIDGYSYAGKINAAVNGSTEDVFGNTVTVTRSLGLYMLIYHMEAPVLPTVTIKYFGASRTVDYRSTICFEADASHIPADAQIVWHATGANGATKTVTGDTFTENGARFDFDVYAAIEKTDAEDADTPYAVSDTVHIHVRTGLFARIIAFFRSLFNRLPIITQEYLGAEICE